MIKKGDFRKLKAEMKKAPTTKTQTTLRIRKYNIKHDFF